jgi:hypothetical protein
MSETPPHSTRAATSRRLAAVTAGSPYLRAAVLLVGLAVSLLMVARSQVGGDQLHLLSRGWQLAAEGSWVHYGMPTSAGGKSPGTATTLMVGAPLLVWRDYRAPTALLWLTHLLAYLLLDRIAARTLSPRGRLLLGLLYWLNPWRVFFSAHLWNVNYMFLAGALHAWTSFGQRRQATFWLSFLHVATIGVAAQLHTSAPVLLFASALLLWRGYLKINWPGAFAGAVAVGATLVPWALTVLAHRELLPGGTGFPFRGLVLVFPLLRGLIYWLRYPSLFFTRRMTDFDLTATLGPLADHLLAKPLWALLVVAGTASLLLPFLANRWMWRRDRRWLAQRADASWSARRWLHGYVVACFAAAVISFAASPTTIMAWQGFVVMHAAVLPLVLWVETLLRSRARAWAARGTLAYAVVVSLLLVVMAVGTPLFRRGGRDAVSATVAAPHAMFDELGITSHCTLTVDPAVPFWPDALPPPAPAPRPVTR